MTIKIPNEQKKFKQIANSDVLGNIWSSFNMDFTENLGRVRVSPRCMIVDSSLNNVFNLETPVSFSFYDDGSNERIWCLAGSRLFYNNGDSDDTFTEDATVGTPTTLDSDCDMINFNGAIYLAGDGNLYKYDGAWTTVSSAPNGGNCQMCVFGGILYATQSTSEIFAVDSSDTVIEPTATPNTQIYTIDISDFGEGTPANNTITAIRSASDRIWIATVNIGGSQNHATGLKGKVFEWDGVSTQPTRVYYLDSMGAMSLVIKDDIPYVLDADGKLLKFNGSSFIEVASLPLLPSEYLRNPGNSTTVQRFIHPRGMIVRDEKIIMLINNISIDGTTIFENLPSGIWEYDDDIGLYHKFSVSLWNATTSSTRTDFAQNRLSEVGALFASKNTSSNDRDGDIMFGAKFYTSATDTVFGIFTNNTNDTKSKVGYFVTTKIDSQSVQDVWQKVYVKHKKLLDSTDRIEVKYRTDEVTPIEGTITWTSTTQFTSTIDLSTIAVGDEWEGTRGTGSGQIEHITAISYSNPTYTVTLANAVTGASGTASGRFQKWIKIGSITNQVEDWKEMPIDVKSNWIQLKCVMYFTGKDELNELELVNKTNKPSV